MAIKGIFAAALALAVLPAAADAAITVRIGNVGSDVVVRNSGTFNLTGLDRLSDDEAPNFPNSLLGGTFFRIGGYDDTLYFTGLTGPQAFGGELAGIADGAGFGDALALSIVDNGISIGVARGYGGRPTDGASLFRNTTIAALGLIDGTYTFTAPSDTITVIVGATDVAPVPEPATWALMLSGFAMVGGAMRYRRAVRAAIA